jgi:hypothetical protein
MSRHWIDHFKSDLRSDQDHRLKKDLRSDQDQFFLKNDLDLNSEYFPRSTTLEPWKIQILDQIFLQPPETQ